MGFLSLVPRGQHDASIRVEFGMNEPNFHLIGEGVDVMSHYYTGIPTNWTNSILVQTLDLVIVISY